MTAGSPARTISHSDIKVCDGVWRIKQLNKVFDREKLNLLQRYRGKMRRRELASEASNLLASNIPLGSSISPLGKNPAKHSVSLAKEK